MTDIPILQPGDRVHIAAPDTGDGGAQVHQELMAIYASQGVSVICTTAINRLSDCRVVAVFRDPVPLLRKREDGLWEEKYPNG